MLAALLRKLNVGWKRTETLNASGVTSSRCEVGWWVEEEEERSSLLLEEVVALVVEEEEGSEERLTRPGTEERRERVSSSSCFLRSLEVTLESESMRRKMGCTERGD